MRQDASCGRASATNACVLKWSPERVEGQADAIEIRAGLLPNEAGMDVEGMDLAKHALDQLLSVGW